jgi:hypothetical protein
MWFGVPFIDGLSVMHSSLLESALSDIRNQGTGLGYNMTNPAEWCECITDRELRIHKFDGRFFFTPSRSIRNEVNQPEAIIHHPFTPIRYAQHTVITSCRFGACAHPDKWLCFTCWCKGVSPLIISLQAGTIFCQVQFPLRSPSAKTSEEGTDGLSDPLVEWHSTRYQKSSAYFRTEDVQV